MAKKQTASEEQFVARTPRELLELHGEEVGKVYLVWSPGESDFGPYETILFISPDGRPRTAVLVNEMFVCKPGWNRFYVECYR